MSSVYSYPFTLRIHRCLSLKSNTILERGPARFALRGGLATTAASVITVAVPVTERQMMQNLKVIGTVVGGFLACALVLPACADKPEPQTPAAKTEAPPPPKRLTAPQKKAVQEAQAETGGTGIGFDEEILRLCPAVKPPQFGYDSAKMQQAFQDSLVALADCMKTGKLKGRSLLLVGHADPRGEDDYNMALGGRRADSVRNALQALDVEQSRLDVTSRGELEATGVDEAGWAKDRRVDVKLKPAN